MKRIIPAICLAMASALALAGCAATPITPAQQADNAACTAQADSQYRQDTVDQLARPDQTGLRYTATPNHVFDAETMGALSQRDHQLTRCEENGTNNNPPATNATPFAPHILSN